MRRSDGAQQIRQITTKYDEWRNSGKRKTLLVSASHACLSSIHYMRRQFVWLEKVKQYLQGPKQGTGVDADRCPYCCHSSVYKARKPQGPERRNVSQTERQQV